MRIILNIVLSFLLVFSLNAEKKIENIKITNSGYYRILIYLSETGAYENKLSGKICKLNLRGYSLSDKFPGSEFKVNSDILNKIYLTKSDSSGIIFNFVMGAESEYTIENFSNSSVIAVSIYSERLLSDKDKMYFKALKLENDGQKEKALIEYRKLLSLYPSHPDALFHAGMIRKSLGFNYQSKSNLSQAKKSGNSLPEVSYALSETYDLLGEKDNANKELNSFKSEVNNQRALSFDSSAATVILKDLSRIANDSLFSTLTALSSDSSNITAKTKPLERKIIRTIPVNTDSYYYTIAANALVVLVAFGSVFYIWRLVRKKRNKNPKAASLKAKKGFDMKEKIQTESEPEFLKIMNTYKSELDSSVNQLRVNDSKKYGKTFISGNKDNNELQKAVNIRNEESDIDRLAKKYQVERGKIELALKIIAKNDTESTKGKYLLLMKMLKENMSLEQLASDLRIPRGELELVMNLKNI